MNLFSLHGKHFQDDENRLTANMALLLNEARRGFLPAFLRSIGVEISQRHVSEIKVVIQEGQSVDNERLILDARLSLKDQLVIVLESKVGRNSIQASQALKYARWLAKLPEKRHLLVFVTQIREPLAEKKILQALADNGLDAIHCKFLLWHEVFSILRNSESLDSHSAKRDERRVLKGLPVASATRLSNMFLTEVQKMTYDLCVIDEQLVGDVEDVVIQVQHMWFMQAAMKHNVWFPPGHTRFGLRPAKYVAYYQPAGDSAAPNELPKHISQSLEFAKYGTESAQKTQNH